MVRWRAYTEVHPQLTLLSEPYPTYQFIQHKTIDSQSTFAIRGFGLAMTYEPSGHDPFRIVPFVQHHVRAGRVSDNPKAASCKNFQVALQIRVPGKCW